jgi:hypothetical protein
VRVIRQGRHGNWDAYSVQSCQTERRHVISLPPNGNGLPYDTLSEVHEYVHALLAEQAHPLFGTAQIGTPEATDAAFSLKGIINESVDWFVDGWILTRHPVAFRDRLARHRTMLDPDTVLSALARDPDPIFGRATFAQMAAELRKFANWDGRTGDAVVDAMTDEFLATDCASPSGEALLDLVNRLVPPELDFVAVPSLRPDGEPYWLVCRTSRLASLKVAS